MKTNETFHFAPNSSVVNFQIGDVVVIGPSNEFGDIIGLTADGTKSADVVEGRTGTIVSFSSLFPRQLVPCPSAMVLVDNEVYEIDLQGLS